MSTGSIALTFETPDLTLTGSGVFDITEAFQSIIATNSQIKDEISLKIADIFRRIPAQDVADEWVRKIKKSFNFEDVKIDLTKEISKKTNELIKQITFDKIDIQPVNSTKPTKAAQTKTPSQPLVKEYNDKTFENFTKYIMTDKHFQGFIKFFTIDRNFQNFLKNFSGNISTFEKSTNKFIKGLSDNLSLSKTSSPTPTDTVFENSNAVVVSDFTTKALDKLSSIFSMDLGRKLNRKTDDETPVVKKDWMHNIMDKILPALGLAGLSRLPAALRGLVGPALLTGGLLWMAWDAIQGWLLSDEWGVSKIAGALGGAFGGAKSGIEGAYNGMLKGGLVGGGIGMMVGGPIGLVVGALLGAAVFGILGYIGGEKLAKKFDEIGVVISKWYDTDIAPIVNNWKKWMGDEFMPKLTNLWASFKVLAPAIGKLTEWSLKFGGLIITSTLELVVDTLEGTFRGLSDLGTWLGETSFAISNFVETNKDLHAWIRLFTFTMREQDWKTLNNEFKSAFQYFQQSVWDFTEGIKNIFKKTPNKTLDDLQKELKIATQKSDEKQIYLIGKQITQITEQTKLNTIPLDQLRLKRQKLDQLLFPEPRHIIDKLRLDEQIKELEQRAKNREVSPSFKNLPTKKSDKQEIINTQAFIDQPKTITYQPHNKDTLLTLDKTSVFAKPDDILGKTFESIKNQLTTLNNLTQQTVKSLDKHSEIFANLLSVNKDQLQLLPALASQPATNEKQFPLASNDNDRIYKYRNRIRSNLERV
jgi:hypothetical protein